MADNTSKNKDNSGKKKDNTLKKTTTNWSADTKKDQKIVVKGARTHNLKNIDVEMPRGKMIAITGPSGSGKSSLAFDTIFAEGQRRYVESLFLSFEPF
jgi:excinuclease ABC subunit A